MACPPSLELPLLLRVIGVSGLADVRPDPVDDLVEGPVDNAGCLRRGGHERGGPRAHGAGGEIGHITVNRHETATCGCGKHGCLEQYSSATGVVRCMKKLLDENPDADCVLRGRDFEAKDVFDAARNGDALAAREVDEMTDTLGMALATIAATTDPEMFLVGGGVSRAGDVLFDPLVEHYKTYAFKSCRETPIKAASLGNDAGIYGAVRLIVGD